MADGAENAAKPAKEKLSAEEKEKLRLEKEERKKKWEEENKGKLPQKKVLTRKERRDIQDKHKAEKEDAKKKEKMKKDREGNEKQAQAPAQAQKKETRQNNTAGTGRPGGRSRKTIDLFSHLEAPRTNKTSVSLNVYFGEDQKVHPSILSLGLKYADGVISGANARVVAMLLAFKDVIKDYIPPEKTSIARDLDRYIKQMVQFLINCRAHSITMGNAIKHVRNAIATLPPDLTDAEAKEELFAVIDSYIHSNVTVAQEEIVNLTEGKIANGDTILTFGYSSVVEKALLAAYDHGRQFKVVVVSAPPQDEGKRLVKRLAEAGVDCVFVQLTAISYMMDSVSKVILGCAAMFSNGTCLGRSGTALIAMTARSFNKPVLICAETHKFTEKVQLDSICYNELGNPDDLVLPGLWDGDADTKGLLEDWKDNRNLELLNLKYDLTPSEYITMVITEFGLLPASSVPVIVREKEQREAI